MIPPGQAAVQGLQVEHSPERIALARPGRPAPLLVQRADPHRRPYIHPIAAPDEVGVLTEDAPAHHPWQHGLYVGLNDVNGTGFWLEGLRERDRATDGTFHPRPLAAPRLAGPAASWMVASEWRRPDGRPLLTEVQDWHFADLGSSFVLDLVWSLRAMIALTFGPSPYGGLFLRMPYRREWGGEVLTSEGLGAAEAEGARARWVAVSMPIEGRPPDGGRPGHAGMAILDHPQNPEHPVPWRVDVQLGICPSRSIAGAWHLAGGETATARYRLLAFGGPIDGQWLAARWQDFAAATPVSPV